MLSLKDIRKTITSEQRFCLDIIWDYFVDNDEWIPKNLLRRKLRLSKKTEYFNTFENLSDNIVFERFQNNNHHFLLTYLGAFLTTDGPFLEANYIELLKYVLSKYDSDPNNKIIKCSEIEQELGVEDLDLTSLGVLLETVSYSEKKPVRSHGRSGMYKDNSWEIEILSTIEDLSEIDIEEYVRKQAENIYNNIQAESENQTDFKQNMKSKIFIGHGNSKVWRDLKDFLQDRLALEWDEFNREPAAGYPTTERLNQMLDNAGFAFIVMTAEDEHSDGTLHPRENAIHEAGLFQGRLGFRKAIILFEEECSEFSNVKGLTQIRFPKGNIEAKFEEIRKVLEREKII